MVMIWVVILLGSFVAFMILPEGDGGNMVGVFIFQEGTSPV
jgi:hypothetical protein